MLTETIKQDTITSMKEKNQFKLSVLRMLKSALQLETINKKHDLSDEEVIAVIKKQVKIRKDSIEEYTKYQRLDLVENLNKEVEILSAYLPEELSTEQINKVLDDIFNELKPTNQDIGKIMKEATIRFKGQADMKLVNQLVKERLN